MRDYTHDIDRTLRQVETTGLCWVCKARHQYTIEPEDVLLVLERAGFKIVPLSPEQQVKL